MLIKVTTQKTLTYSTSCNRSNMLIKLTSPIPPLITTPDHDSASVAQKPLIATDERTGKKVFGKRHGTPLSQSTILTRPTRAPGWNVTSRRVTKSRGREPFTSLAKSCASFGIRSRSQVMTPFRQERNGTRPTIFAVTQSREKGLTSSAFSTMYFPFGVKSTR